MYVPIFLCQSSLDLELTSGSLLPGFDGDTIVRANPFVMLSLPIRSIQVLDPS